MKVPKIFRHFQCSENKKSVKKIFRPPRRVFLTPDCSSIRGVVSGLLPYDFLELTTFDVDVSNELMSMDALKNIYDNHCSEYFKIKNRINMETRVMISSNRNFVVKAVLNVSKLHAT
jgi:hypothetical protein